MTLHVAVTSGSRADFGPLGPLLVGLRDDDRFQLSTIVCAVAGAEEAERQVAAFAEAGVPVDALVTSPVHPDAPTGPLTMAEQASQALSGIATALEELRPDLLVLLGDRFEIMAAALAAHLQRVPIVHLSGGDETLGSLDDAMRHAISRLAALHLPTNDESARRLSALGIPEDRIVVVGSTALDALVAFTPMTRDELARSIGADLAGRIVAVTYHPATMADEPPAATVDALLAAVREAAPDATIVMTGSNADEGGPAIDAVAQDAAAMDPRLALVPSLGVQRYWSLLHHAAVVVGNSSSALIEAPVVGVPVVDVGERQTSRLRADSCIHVAAEREAIAAGVATALARPRSPEASPYGDGRAVPRVLDLLASLDLAALRAPRSLPPMEG
jgi:UDP-hydrolysing UDP-N-acetyl-D-glucosamine 2-epimerase